MARAEMFSSQVTEQAKQELAGYKFFWMITYHRRIKVRKAFSPFSYSRHTVSTQGAELPLFASFQTCLTFMIWLISEILYPEVFNFHDSPFPDILYLHRAVEFSRLATDTDSLCGLVVRVLGYRSSGSCSISGATRFSEKYWVWNRVHSALRVQFRSYLEEKVAVPV
jgi:hypothetical protein